MPTHGRNNFRVQSYGVSNALVQDLGSSRLTVVDVIAITNSATSAAQSGRPAVARQWSRGICFSRRFYVASHQKLLSDLLSLEIRSLTRLKTCGSINVETRKNEPARTLECARSVVGR